MKPTKTNSQMTLKVISLRFVALMVALCASHVWAVTLNSHNAIVVNDQTGVVMLAKNAEAPVPIASLTKLMTAMVVLDAKPDMEEMISIVEGDVDSLKHSKSRVRVGTNLPRKTVLKLALMSSENRAAAALARTYPGGNTAFVIAVHQKIISLGMTHTQINEATGLSPDNLSTASDLAKMAIAASHYPQIVNITTNSSSMVNMNGRSVAFHNTNRLVGKKGWNILLSKTGFTNEAGHCLIMQVKQAGGDSTLVLLNSQASSASVNDAMKIRHLLTTPENKNAARTATRRELRNGNRIARNQV